MKFSKGSGGGVGKKLTKAFTGEGVSFMKVKEPEPQRYRKTKYRE